MDEETGQGSGGVSDFFKDILRSVGQYGAAIEQRKSEIAQAQINAAAAGQRASEQNAARLLQFEANKELYRNVALALVGVGLIFALTKRAKA